MSFLPDDPQGQKRFLLVLIPLLALAGFMYFFHTGRKAEVAELDVQLEELESSNARARAMAARTGGELEERLALYEEYMVRLERLIPNDEEVAQLLYDISERAQQVGVTLDNLQPAADAPGAYYTRQTYEMVVIGDYHDVGRFLTEVGSLPRIITPINLSLDTAREDDPDDGSVSAEFSIETYVLPPAGQQPVGDSIQVASNASI